MCSSTALPSLPLASFRGHPAPKKSIRLCVIELVLITNFQSIFHHTLLLRSEVDHIDLIVCRLSRDKFAAENPCLRPYYGESLRGALGPCFGSEPRPSARMLLILNGSTRTAWFGGYECMTTCVGFMTYGQQGAQLGCAWRLTKRRSEAH